MVFNLLLNSDAVPIILEPNSSLITSVHVALHTISAILFQVHCLHPKNGMVSIGPEYKQPHISGKDVGFVQTLNESAEYARMFVFNTDSNFNVTVLISALRITNRQPIPGGCNIDWNLPDVAAITVASDNHPYLTVRFEPSDSPIRRDEVPRYSDDCENPQVENSVKYHLYGLYYDKNGLATESEVMVNFQKYELVKRNAKKICTLGTESPTRFFLASWHSSYPLFLTIIVENSTTGEISPYVPLMLEDTCGNGAFCEG